jgi:hypothetical protein
VRLYLDLLHWIGLSKARVGHSDGAKYKPVYDALRQLTAEGTVTTPLSAAHYAEIDARIKSLDQRNDIAITMAELSRYVTLVPREEILRYQFRRAVASALGFPVPPNVEPGAIGYGAGHALGHPVHGGIRGQGDLGAWPSNGADQAIREMEAWVGGGWRFQRPEGASDSKEVVTDLFNQTMEFMLLRGPDQAQVARLRSYGYQPENARSRMLNIADRERRVKLAIEQDADLKNRPNDLIMATTLYYDLTPEILPEICRDLGTSTQAFFSLQKSGISSVLADTPILVVEMALRRGMIKNGNYMLQVNDIYDQDALGVAVIACDLVATDKSAAHRLNSAKVGRTFVCKIVASPADVLQAIDTAGG